MLERARAGKFAYPAVNVTSLTTANAVLKGLADSKSDGIIQVSTGGAAFASGSSVKDMALGAISIAEHVHLVANRYPIYVALHTDHCQANKLDSFVLPLVEETERRRAAGKPNLFSSHMFDGSALPLKENLDISGCSSAFTSPISSWKSKWASSAAKKTASRRAGPPSSTRPQKTPSKSHND